MSSPVVTRFAPSPTGALHLGNARTALFNWLHARRAGGRFVLRIEDTDATRSDDAHVESLLADLAWLGLDWDAGPDREDAGGPYRQSRRGGHYAAAWSTLEADERVYPCWCSAEELELARRLQVAAGRPPRYAGTCATLDAAARAARAASGRAPTLRFRVPSGEVVEWHDHVRGPQRVASDELGDFVVRRADGTAPFLFCNLVDDAAMGVTLVLRGEDHVANTPRQLLLARALRLAAPEYGHLPLLVGDDGAPLSKRHGSTSLAELRASGFLPEAVANLLCRLGHAGEVDGWLEPAQMIEGFRLERLGRAPARFDAAQLRHWQKEAVPRAPDARLLPWVRGRAPPGAEAAFLAAVRANLLLPADAAEWGHVVYGELPCATGELRACIAAAGPAFWQAALESADREPATLVAALRSRTGRRGRELFQPLRAALTHRLDGPELAALLAVLPREQLLARLRAAAALATRTEAEDRP